MPTIVISGYYGAGNTGDEAILAAMLQVLQREIPGAELVILSRDPARTAADHRVAALHRSPWRDIRAKARLFSRADLLISGGGGLLQDAFPKRRLPVSVLYYLLVCVAAKLYGCRVIFYAQGVGPLRTRLARWLTRAVANRADLITVRDSESAALLAAIGVCRPGIRVTADPVLAWEPEISGNVLVRWDLTEPGRQDRQQPGPLQDQSLLAISVRPWPGDDAQWPVLAEVADRAVRQWGLRPVFVPLAGKGDTTASEQLRSLMVEGARAVVLPDLSPPEVYEVISKARLLLGMRLHALIFAVLAGVPAVGLSYDPKVESFLRRIGLDDQCCPWGAGAEHVWRALETARSGWAEKAPSVAGSVRFLREQALENARLAKVLLEEL